MFSNTWLSSNREHVPSFPVQSARKLPVALTGQQPWSLIYLFILHLVIFFFLPSPSCVQQPPIPFLMEWCLTTCALSDRVAHQSKSWEHFRLFIPALLPSCREVLGQLLNLWPSGFPSVKHTKITILGQTSVCLGMSRVIIHTVLSRFEGLL